MYKMINGIQHYDWGSRTAMAIHYGYPNPQHKPMAEMWMGAHPQLSSQILTQQGMISLYDAIKQDPVAFLGQQVYQRFGELPFLFKVLAAEMPLSIQVHPNKQMAEQGFINENQKGIQLSAPYRNYKDSNHKPELLYALSQFQAINGFRHFTEIAALLKPLVSAHPMIKAFVSQPDASHLQQLFTTLLSLTGKEKQKALLELNHVLDKHQDEPWQTIRNIRNIYPDDIGLFAPLLMNVIELKPGEAMFLYAGTPHAYLHGFALEIMANSDNVLRAGLTPKYIDIPELLANIDFTEKHSDDLRMLPDIQSNTLNYPIPVDDFAFSIHQLTKQPLTLYQESAAILFVIEGKADLHQQGEQLSLKAGESCFITASDGLTTIQGTGKIARVYNF